MSRGPGDHRGRVLIVDVAREAGVSAQTVSNVVNQRDGFSEETRQRVLAAIERTGYRPNRVARNLRTRRSGQIGLHLPASQLGIQNSFSMSFLRAVIDAATRAEHQLVVFTHPLDDDISDDRGFVSSGLDAFILYNVDTSDPRPRLLAEAGIPFAVLGRVLPPLPQAWVDIDNARAMVDVVDHLVQRGHRRFGYLGYDEPEYWNHERLAGTRDRLASHGLEIDERWLLLESLETVRGSVARLLGSGRPDAIICASDSLAVIAHAEALHAGLVPGADIAITGFDGLPLPMDVDPPLTSVELPVRAAAGAVVDLVLGQIEGRPPPHHGIILPTRLVVGGSA